MEEGKESEENGREKREEETHGKWRGKEREMYKREESTTSEKCIDYVKTFRRQQAPGSVKR